MKLQLATKKSLHGFRSCELRTNRYKAEAMTLWCFSFFLEFYIMLFDTQHRIVREFLAAWVFSWSDDGFQRIEEWALFVKGLQPAFDVPAEMLHMKLLIIVSSNDAATKGEMTSFVPSPADIAEIERNYMSFRRW